MFFPKTERCAMSAADEIKAMGAISEAVEGLESEGRARVLLWAVSHYGVAIIGQKMTKPLGGSEAAAEQRSSGYETFADLFNAANPKTEKDKAAVAAYYAQVCGEAGSFQSQSLNDLLKNLGHGIGNITEALNQLKNERPALILQLKKSGSSRQARKTYKLTLEGIKRVESMTRGEALE
jgi:hypothetical protein